jgi:hypothetical protein
MPITLGPTFDTAILTLAGIDPTTVDPGTLEVSTLNPDGYTTIRACVAVQVPTADLITHILNALPH